MSDSFRIPRAALAILLSGLCVSAVASPDPFLKTSGLAIRNDSGQGDVVPLRGVNLGAWLLMESWMCPMDSSGNLDDDWSVRNTLTQRFGAATKDSLLRTYENTWIQEADFNNIAALGMNVVRLPFWYLNLEEEDGTWRGDAFDRLDWAVSNAWARGIYTILDLHGAPGGQRANADTTGRIWPSAQLWTSSTYRARTIEIWQRISQHFEGNPAVAGYDLLNEPMDTPSMQAYWSLLDDIYHTIRTNDPDHIIIMEATYGSWNLNMLPNPASYDWSNVVYQLHVYPWDVWDDVTQLNAVTDNTVQDFVNHQGWNVPCHVGEFNMSPEAAWKYAVETYSGNGMGWQMWAYKSTYTGGTTSWGVYNPNGSVTAVPNSQTHSASVINNRWSQWTTASAFSLNPSHKRTLAMPVVNDDNYTLDTGAILNMPAPGVLGNDTHLNLGGAGIQLQAVKVSDPDHGSVALNTDGSFIYTADGGYSGPDSFRYKVWDGRIDSVRNATVAIQVVTNNTVGPAAQLIWSIQPGLATNGWPFSQQPVLRTADEFGHPSTNGLKATLDVTVRLSAGEGPLLGTTNFNIGTTGSNGVVHFTDLQINSVGSNKVLIAEVHANTNASSGNLLINGDFSAGSSGWTTWVNGWANFEIPAKLASGTYVNTNGVRDPGLPDLDLVGVYDGSMQLTVGGYAGGYAGAYQIIAATAGGDYTLRVQSGAEDWWLPTGEIRLIWLDSSNGVIASDVVSTTDSIHGPDLYDYGVVYQDWTNHATAPAGTSLLKVELANPVGTGSVWFDNAVLTQSIQVPALTAATTQPFTVHPATPVSQTNYVAGITDAGRGRFTVHFVGTMGVQYCVQTTTSLAPPISWETLAGSANTVTNADGVWFCTVTNAVPQRFYRSVVVTP